MNIYIVCPGHHKTGGTELAHQLCASLKRRGKNASMAYFDGGEGLEVNPAFARYVDTACCLDDVADAPDQLLIFPEVAVRLIERFPLSKKALWWMSVDNFRLLYDTRFKIALSGTLRGIKHFVTKKRLDYRGLALSCDWHLYQSEYAREFAQGMGVEEGRLLRLGDYVNEAYLDGRPEVFSAATRERRVLYNPVKGYRFTNRLISAAPDIDWVPLRGFTNEQVVELMRATMLYIDFGNHPGKDRMPREAAISGCCVIVGRKGSACFDEDVPVPQWAKFDVCEKNIDPIISAIRRIFDDYETAIGDYGPYRESIAREPEQFESDIDSLLATVEG